jgi:single-strand DNA-binding protein
MADINKAILIGRLGRDPEVRNVGDSQVARFSVATSRQWTDKAGQKQERTQWHNCQAWGKLAELAQRFLAKGRRVYIEGEIEYREYEKDGQKRTATEINVREMVFLDAPPVGERDEQPRQQRTTAPKPPTGGDDFFDNSVNF